MSDLDETPRFTCPNCQYRLLDWQARCPECGWRYVTPQRRREAKRDPLIWERGPRTPRTWLAMAGLVGQTGALADSLDLDAGFRAGRSFRAVGIVAYVCLAALLLATAGLGELGAARLAFEGGICESARPGGYLVRWPNRWQARTHFIAGFHWDVLEASAFVLVVHGVCVFRLCGSSLSRVLKKSIHREDERTWMSPILVAAASYALPQAMVRTMAQLVVAAAVCYLLAALVRPGSSWDWVMWGLAAFSVLVVVPVVSVVRATRILRQVRGRLGPSDWYPPTESPGQ